MPEKAPQQPKVHSFSVRPNRIVKGEEVTLTWDCSGVEGVKIELRDVRTGELVCVDQLGLAIPGDVPTAHGTAKVKPDRSAVCMLTAGSATANLIVDVFEPSAASEPSAPSEPKKAEVASVELIKPAKPDECPNCRQKAPDFEPPVHNHLFDDRIRQIKEQTSETDDKKVVEQYLRVHGGYITHCQGCGTDFFVKV